jgi:hypothetical protein
MLWRWNKEKTRWETGSLCITINPVKGVDLNYFNEMTEVLVLLGTFPNMQEARTGAVKIYIYPHKKILEAKQIL